MIKRINDGWANLEAGAAMGMLLLMIGVAFAQALFRNLTLVGFGWANLVLEQLSWADFILQKGTLWLAFLGASLAVHADKHVAIDIVPRALGPRGRMVLRGLVGLLGGVICLFLARAFWNAVAINGQERPAEVEIQSSLGPIHVCDATPAQVAESTSRPGQFCYVRSALRLVGAEVDTPGAAFQLIVPAMFVVMALRMFGNGIQEFARLARGEVDPEQDRGSSQDESAKAGG